MPHYAIGDRAPEIHRSAFVHPEAVIIGDVAIGPEASIWPCAVLRGDHGRIRIGARTSVQDGAVIHCTSEHDTTVGDDCTIGHLAHLEGCILEDGSLVGSGAVVLHRSIIRSGAVVAAQALVAPGTDVTAGALARGVPARVFEGAADPELIGHAARTYLHNAHWYNAQMRRID